MKLAPEELDALLKFLDRQWMPDIVQRPYDKLADEKRSREMGEQRLADLERRLHAAAAQPCRTPGKLARDLEAEPASTDANPEEKSRP
jgi:hypothetical protein